MEAWLVVLLYGLITALATGLGALPFIFVRHVFGRTVACANAVAAGLMLGASFGLVAEGTLYGHWQTLVGAVLGMLFILGTQRTIHEHKIDFSSLGLVGGQRALLIVVVMTIHSFAEGVAVGVAFGGGEKLALLITMAIAVHNVPEGLAISAVLRPHGASLLACIGWSIVSSLPQPLMAVPAFLFVDAFRPVLPYGLGFAAGAMVFMVLDELLPEAYEEASRPVIGLLVSTSLAGMILLQQYL
ncbi:MAG: ZIP family metal transporter [Acidobacteria bacterium]|nr:ZIP family metal transporter [Acidobacteriota bacterium]